MSSTTREKETLRKLNLLISAVDKIYPSVRQLMLRSFIQGIFIGLGTTIGASIVISIATFILSKLNLLTHVSLFK